MPCIVYEFNTDNSVTEAYCDENLFRKTVGD